MFFTHLGRVSRRGGHQMEPMTWDWRLVALGLLIAVMAIYSKILWALVTNGHEWIVVGLMHVV